MKSWNSNAFATAPAHLQAGCQRLKAYLASLCDGPHPKLVEVMVSPFGDQEEYVFEIAAGLRMPVGRESDDDDLEFWETAARRAIAATKVASSVAPMAEFVARRLRGLIADAQARGLAVRMHRVDMAEYGHWHDKADAKYNAGFQTLSTALIPEVVWMHVDCLSDLERQFEEHMGELRDRSKALIELGRNGADGTIDALSLQALLQEPSPAMVLEALRDDLRVELIRGATLFWCEGHVWSHGGHDADRFGWMRNVIKIRQLEVSATNTVVALGKPVTNMLPFPLLTDEMIVGSLEFLNDEEATTEIELELPRFHFDITTGKVW